MEAVDAALPEVKAPVLVQHLDSSVIYSVRVCVCRLSVLQGRVVLAVRQQYVTIDDQLVTLGDGDEVAVVPPLSGG